MKKTILLLLVLTGIATSSKAQLSAGFFSATASSDLSSVGTQSWNTPGGGTLGYAINIPPGTVTHGLHFNGFGFNIPLASNIVGVQAILSYCVMPSGTGPAILKDSIVRLVVGNVPTGNNLGSAHNFTPIVTTYTYGDPADTWGVPLTPAVVNATNFGFVSNLKSIGTASAFAGVEKSNQQAAKMKIFYASTTGVIESQTSYASAYCYSRTLYVNNVTDETKLEVFNLEGRRVHETVVTKDESKVDLSKLTPGVYFYRMMIDKKEIVQKILIE